MSSSLNESPLVFAERWTAQLRALQESLRGKGNSAATAEERTSVQQLSEELTARAADLPAFELRRCERELKALQDTIVAANAAAAPRSKFSFKRTAPVPPSGGGSAAVTADRRPRAPPSASHPSTSAPPPTALALAHLERAHLTAASLPSPPLGGSTAAGGSALALTSLTACLIDLRDAPEPYGAVYLTDLKECVVLLPGKKSTSVGRGSALVQNCEKCVIALTAHQFRMHDSSTCAILLQAGSDPVIERCRALLFGHFPPTRIGAERPLLPAAQSLEAAQLAPPPAPAMRQVQDFDDPFASPERPSANWRALSVAEQEAFEHLVASLDAERGTGPEAESTVWEDVRAKAVQLVEERAQANGR